MVLKTISLSCEVQTFLMFLVFTSVDVASNPADENMWEILMTSLSFEYTEDISGSFYFTGTRFGR